MARTETKFHAYDRRVEPGRRKSQAVSGRTSYGEFCFLITLNHFSIKEV